jgi:hypothetical protein
MRWFLGIYIVAALVLVTIAVFHRREGFAQAFKGTGFTQTDRSIRLEGFISPEAPPMDLQKTLTQVQGLLTRFATPEVMTHMASVINKDPGELARMHIESLKKRGEQ